MTASTSSCGQLSLSCNLALLLRSSTRLSVRVSVIHSLYAPKNGIIDEEYVVLGFVRAPVTTTFLQVVSRLFLVWAVNYMFPDVRSHWSFSTMMIAWSIAECVRYSYYGFNLLGNVPRILTWARYNFFLVLYPLGVGSELLMVYNALPLAYKWNPMYFYFLIAASLVYVPGKLSSLDRLWLRRAKTFNVYCFSLLVGFPVLFSHMLVQRKKYLKETYQVAQKKKEL